MSFLITVLEYKDVILFYSAILLVIFLNKDRLQKQGPLMYLYKTKIGLNLMDRVNNRFRKLIKIWGYIGIFLAYIGLIAISYLLVRSAYDLLVEKPGAVGGGLVVPGLPIAGLGIKFPLIIGWISLFIIMAVHEFSHGMVARAHNQKVKSSGIGFFGPLMLAFVELDEKKLEKQPHRMQHSIFAAGPVSNAVLWIVCLFLVLGVSSASTLITVSKGVNISAISNDTMPAFIAGVPNNTVVSELNEIPITNIGSLEKEIERLKPNEKVTLTSKEGDKYSFTTITHPEDNEKAYLGIWILGEDFSLKEDSAGYHILWNILKWLYELFWWTGFISINIGLINLFPIFITDGARMLLINFQYFIKDKKKAMKWWKNVNIAALVILLIILFLPMLRNMFRFFVSFYI
ncbi:site-2 protease family protein [Candidatus Woesearchaeota archaeon]|nr:site-2 protease family protein [Candidatus Woesearchaeota archaeon]